jgi:RNA polymerase sigma-70 factor (ECF subfamily)
MKGVCLRYSGNEQEAEDLLQDSFLKAFDKIKTFKNDGAIGGWLRKLTLNTALEYYRKNKRTNQTFELTDYSLDLIDDTIIEQLELEDLLSKIQKLPTGFRTIFNLYAIEGYNHREIAELLDISDGTSKSQYSRARKLLKNMITKEEEMEQKNFKHAK